MTSVCFYFQVHQPFRLNWYWPENSKSHKGPLSDLYFDSRLNEFTFRKVAGKCYHKANDIILSQIDRFKGQNRKFKVSFSLSGTFLDQCERWDKDLLEKFKQMAESGCVEFLSETYYHSLSSLYEDRAEFVEQVRQHQQAIRDLFGQNSKVFRNTELLYHNEIAKEVEGMGFKAIMTEGIERILDGWRSPNYIYKRKDGNIKVLLRNYRLSDDIGYRFSSKWWSEHPLTADKYAAWLSSTPGSTVNVFIDYETFGEHHWEDTGIFWFLGSLPQEVLKWQNLQFATPSEVVEQYPAVGDIDVPYFETVSWADLERDASAWLGNHMQHMAFNQIKELEKMVKQTGNGELLKIWRYLQTGDHFYYMCTKCLADGDVHKYFSHHGNPYDAGVNYLSVLADFKQRILAYLNEAGKKVDLSALKPPEVIAPTPFVVQPKTPELKPTRLEQKPLPPSVSYVVSPRTDLESIRLPAPAKKAEQTETVITPAVKKPVPEKKIEVEKPKPVVQPVMRIPRDADTVIMHSSSKQTTPVETPKPVAQPESKTQPPIQQGQIKPGFKITPEQKYAHTSSEVKQSRLPIGVTQGLKITPEQKYAHTSSQPQKTKEIRSGVNPGVKTTPQEKYASHFEPSKESKPTEISTSNTIIRAKNLTPGEKYAPEK